MTEHTEQTPLSPDELTRRLKQVRKVVYIRGSLLGLIVACWWVFFAPESVVDGRTKNVMGVLAGMIASGAYFFMLRESIFPKKP